MIERLCKDCGTAFKQYNTTQTRCPKCTYNRYAKPRKPIKRMGKIAKKWTAYRQEWIAKNDDGSGRWKCYICGKILTVDTLTLDHVIPRSRRPDLRFEDTNIKPCCFDCNSEKGSKVL